MDPYNPGKPDYYLYKGKGNVLIPTWEVSNSKSSQNSDNKTKSSKDRKRARNDHATSSKDRTMFRDNKTNEERTKRVRNDRNHRRKKGRNKMSTGFTQFLRYATTIFTFIIFLAGAGILGLGVYALGSDYGARELSSVLGNDLYLIAAYVLIGTGGVLIIISICGCCGAQRESKVMLGVFVVFITLLVLAQVAAAIIVFVLREKMSNDVIHSMEDVLIKKYGVNLSSSDNRMITDMWNFLQKQLKCCGVTGTVNSTTSWAIYKMSKWNEGFSTGKPLVPQSCCRPEGDVNRCTGIVDFDGPPTRGPPMTSNMMSNPELYTAGCYDELVQYIQDHVLIIGVSSIAAVVLMLFGLTFSICFCRKLDVDYY